MQALSTATGASVGSTALPNSTSTATVIARTSCVQARATPNGTKTGVAGNTVGCPHTFTAQSSASISFDIASTVTNPVLFQVKVD